MKDYIIRKPKLSDLDSLTKFINELSKEKTFINFQGEKITKKEQENYLKNIVKDKRSVHLVLVDSKNKILGKTEIALTNRVRSHIGGFGIALLKEARGKGLGKKLIKEIISVSIKELKDLKIINLSVFENNVIAKNLYQKLGFKECGRLPKGIKYKGKYVDEIFMYKNL